MSIWELYDGNDKDNFIFPNIMFLETTSINTMTLDFLEHHNEKTGAHLFKGKYCNIGLGIDWLKTRYIIPTWSLIFYHPILPKV